MTQSNVVLDQLKPYLTAFYTHARLWVIPTVVMAALGVVVAVARPVNWMASQAMLVRDEAIGNQNGPGQFGSIDWMKVFQEKILEVAHSRLVVAAVLARVGPPARHLAGQPWPAESDITAMRDAISVSAPRGAEFGRTEFFHLSVIGPTPEAALLRTRIVCDELERNLGDLRKANAQSVIAELERAQAIAQSDLDQATARLEALEREVGEDLGELRLLSEHGSGDSNLRTTLNQIKQELRQAETIRESLRQLKELLEHAQQDTTDLLATPSRLLELQPSLRSLKEKLTEAQTDLSKLRGVMSESHPKVKAAALTEQRIRQQLQEEVKSALRGMDADLASNASQIETMQKQFADVQKRLDRLANLRAGYGNLVADTRQCGEALDAIKQRLTDARAAQNAALATSQLTRFGEPIVGDRPVGPGKKLVVVASTGSGLALGAGLVFLFMPIGPNGSRRRWNDYLNLGRRATDQILGRRASDRQAVGARTGAGNSAVGARRTEDATVTHQVPSRRTCDPPAKTTEKSTFPEVDRRGGSDRRALPSGDSQPTTPPA